MTREEADQAVREMVSKRHPESDVLILDYWLTAKGVRVSFNASGREECTFYLPRAEARALVDAEDE